MKRIKHSINNILFRSVSPKKNKNKTKQKHVECESIVFMILLKVRRQNGNQHISSVKQ
jgi:hypothetical protein